MIKKILIPLNLNEVAPRFDLSGEVVIIMISRGGHVEEERGVVLTEASAEKLCHFILAENINTVICGAIEDEYYQFLKWKKIKVIDMVFGDWKEVFKKFTGGSLSAGEILCTRMVEGENV